jgi:2'-hydroxyisoflavone reductase
MDILLLGGPRFLGLATIEAALAAGHRMTTFNRGRTNPDLYPMVEKLYGDRDGGLDALKGRRWDVVIDTCGYLPRVVGQSAELLAQAVGRYIFISTVSVYASPLASGAPEDAPLATLEDPTVEAITGESYGGLKVRCEQVVQATYGDRSLVIRPGLIVGPHDPTNRFTYWVTRVAAGGDVLAPDDRDAPVQVVDVRDLAEWTIRLAEAGATGVYNAIGPVDRLTLEGVLHTCQAVAASDARFVWVSPQFLAEQGVVPWTEVPLWVPGEDAWNEVNIDRALAAGLTFRPLATTVGDTLAWAQTQPQPDPPSAGLPRTRETELLAAWETARR